MDVEQNSPLQSEELPAPLSSSTDAEQHLSLQSEETPVLAPSSTDAEQHPPPQSEETPVTTPSSTDTEQDPPLQSEDAPATAPSSTDAEQSSPVQNEEPTITASTSTDEEPSSPAQDEEPPIPAPSSVLTRYSLRFAGGPSIGQLVAIAVATGVYTALSWYCSVFLNIINIGPIVSPLFFAIGFGIAFAIWFGEWAFVIAYIGNAVGAGILTGQIAVGNALWFGTVDLIQLGLPMLLYRLLASRFGVNPIGKDVFTFRGFIFFLVCAVLPGNIIGGAYGSAILVWTGVNPSHVYYLQWVIWSTSNIVFTIIIGSILLSGLSPVVERFGLTVRNALN